MINNPDIFHPDDKNNQNSYTKYPIVCSNNCFDVLVCVYK